MHTIFSFFLIFTCPSCCRVVVFPVVEDNVKDHQNHECEIVGNNSFSAGELSIIDNIKPDTEEEDPRYAVQSCLQHQKRQVCRGERVLLCTVSLNVGFAIYKSQCIVKFYLIV